MEIVDKTMSARRDFCPMNLTVKLRRWLLEGTDKLIVRVERKKIRDVILLILLFVLYLVLIEIIC